MSKIPEHLLQRARERRAAIGLGQDETDPTETSLYESPGSILKTKIPPHLLALIEESKERELLDSSMSGEMLSHMIAVPAGMDKLVAEMALVEFDQGKLIEVPDGMDPKLARDVLTQFYDDWQHGQPG